MPLVAVNIGDGRTVENVDVAAADVTANWNTVLDNWDTAAAASGDNDEDVILCTHDSCGWCSCWWLWL